MILNLVLGFVMLASLVLVIMLQLSAAKRGARHRSDDSFPGDVNGSGDTDHGHHHDCGHHGGDMGGGHH